MAKSSARDRDRESAAWDREGHGLRVPGRGLTSADSKSPPGDLLVVVRSRPDPRFERDGANLWRAEQVEIPDAVLGATREVPTLDGTAISAKKLSSLLESR